MTQAPASHDTKRPFIDTELIGTTESGKTKIWAVVTLSRQENGDLGDQSTKLGEIRWFGRWRKYVFYPEPNMLFDQSCLETIGRICGDQTNRHAVDRRAVPRAPIGAPALDDLPPGVTR